MQHHFKTFILGKDGEADGHQDALAVNPDSGLYIVADGVSNSYHPEMLSNLLCHMFSKASHDELLAWDEYVADVLMPACTKAWNTGIEEYLGTLDLMERDHEEMQRERNNFGASTFCGIWIDNDGGMLRYYICGDSTLFVRMKDGRVAEFNTAHKYTDERGRELSDYTNRTYALSTHSGYVSEEWTIGSLSIDEIDSVSLMTDGMAEWFQRTLIDGEDPFSILWATEDDAEFGKLAKAERARGGMDDDLAAILIKIEEQAEAPLDVMEEKPMQRDERCMAITLYRPGYIIPLMPETTAEETAVEKAVEKAVEETETEATDQSLSLFRNAVGALKRLISLQKRKDNNS